MSSLSSQSSVLAEIRRFYPEYHPLVSIARLAHKEGVDVRLLYDCHKTIAKYVEPELKSLEVRGVFEDVRRVSVSLFQDDISDAVLVDKQPVLLANSELVDAIVDGY